MVCVSARVAAKRWDAHQSVTCRRPRRSSDDYRSGSLLHRRLAPRRPKRRCDDSERALHPPMAERSWFRARAGNHRVGCAGCPGYEMSKSRSLAGALHVSRCRFNEGVNIPEGIWGGIAALVALIGPRRPIPRGVRGAPASMMLFSWAPWEPFHVRPSPSTPCSIYGCMAQRLRSRHQPRPSRGSRRWAERAHVGPVRTRWPTRHPRPRPSSDLVPLLALRPPRPDVSTAGSPHYIR